MSQENDRNKKYEVMKKRQKYNFYDKVRRKEWHFCSLSTEANGWNLK